MTYKNAKTILFASLLVAMILPFSSMNMADATEAGVPEPCVPGVPEPCVPGENVNERDTKTQGKLYITDIKNKNLDILEMNKLHQIASDKNYSAQSQNIASDRMNIIKEQFENKGGISKQSLWEIRGHIDSVTEEIDNLRENYNIAIVTVGSDFENESLRIGIDREGLTDSKIQYVEKHIRKIVGDKVGITLEFSDPVYFTGCSQTGDCNPMQGGVKIQAEGAYTLFYGIQSNIQ